MRADHTIARRPVAVHGPEWDWILQTAPRLDIEGLKVRAFLDWIARETGWKIEFADPEAAYLADSTVLHGSIDHLSPAEAPGVVLASCGLGYRVSRGTMVVFVAEEDRQGRPFPAKDLPPRGIQERQQGKPTGGSAARTEVTP